jgi:hypothetical protein
MAYNHHMPLEDDLDDDHNETRQWDFSSIKSSHAITMPSMPPIDDAYEQLAIYQQNLIVDYLPTCTPQFPHGFRGHQRTYTQSSAGFSSVREKLMKRRVRRQSYSETTCMPDSSCCLIYLISIGSLSSKYPCRMAIWLLMSRSRRILSLRQRRVMNSAPCGYVVTSRCLIFPLIPFLGSTRL